MKNKKSSLIALIVTLVMVFNACSNPFFGNNDRITFLDSPIWFSVDSGGNFSETDTRRSVFLVDENAHVIFYSDDIEPNFNRVSFVFGGNSVTFFFERNHSFPASLILKNSEETFNGFFSAFNSETQTFDLRLEQGADYEIWSNIPLNKNELGQFEDDQLTSSQRLRIRNLHIAIYIYKSLYDFIATHDVSQARFIRRFMREVGAFFNQPVVQAGIFIATAMIYLAAGPKGWAVLAASVLLYAVLQNVEEELFRIPPPTSITVGYSFTGGTTGGDGGGGGGVPGPVAVTGVSLNNTSINLNAGATATLTATVTPANAANRDVSWSSSNEAIATVTQTGTVTGVSAGMAIITVTTADGGRTATSTVTVAPIPVTGVTLDRNSVSLIVGATDTLTATVTPANATNRDVEWYSTAPAVASVSSSGIVIGNSVGTATIRVTTLDGGRIASSTVTVNPVPITNVGISIAAPSTGAFPATTASATGNFTAGTVTWAPPHVQFQGNTVYTATVTLTANSGYGFTGLSTATINGHNATISNNTGQNVTLSVTFPQTDDRTVTNMEIFSPPTRLVYIHGDQLDLSGLVVRFTYDDTTTEDVPAANFAARNITANPANNTPLVHSVHNGQPVTITFGNLPPRNTSNLTVNPRALTGIVSIIGDPIVGETLTANTSALRGSGAISFEWRRNGSLISGANNSTYVLQAADHGATITVTVSRPPNYSGSITSTPTAPVTVNFMVTNPIQWNAAFNTIRNAGSGTPGNPRLYTITVNGDFEVPAFTTTNFGMAEHIEVKLVGSGNLNLRHGVQGSIFIIMDNQKLIIDGVGLNLQGHTVNNTSVLRICANGKIELRNGAISGNTAGSSGGGGVLLTGGSTFTMTGGTISGNTAGSTGGGVRLMSGTTFIMSGGTIAGNTAGNGFGGVGVDGTFTMTGGAISGNTAGSSGGGVGALAGSTFTMAGGTIIGNTAGGDGGGVVVGTGSTFNMSSGTISGNIAGGPTSTLSRGGGVNVLSSTFTMTGGIITGNTVIGPTFTNGGGVNISLDSTFNKSGPSIITGWGDDPVNGNVVRDQFGAVLNNRGHAVWAEVFNPALTRRRENTAGSGVNLSWNGITRAYSGLIP